MDISEKGCSKLRETSGGGVKSSWSGRTLAKESRGNLGSQTCRLECTEGSRMRVSRKRMVGQGSCWGVKQWGATVSLGGECGKSQIENGSSALTSRKRTTDEGTVTVFTSSSPLPCLPAGVKEDLLGLSPQEAGQVGEPG